VVKDVTRDPSLLSRRNWATAEKIHGFDAQPIRYKDEVLGVLGLFTRIPIPEQGPAWLRIFADHIAVAFVNARAFEVPALLKCLSGPFAPLCDWQGLDLALRPTRLRRVR